MMGFFKSIFKGIKNVLFGSPDKVKWVPPSQLIPPPSKEEKELLSKIYPITSASLDKAKQLDDLSYTYLQRALGNFDKISRGELPPEFKKAVEFRFKQDLGRILDRYARRGIINSSVAQRAINDALTRADKLSVDYLSRALALSQAPYSLTRTAKEDYYYPPLRLYNLMLSTRYRLPAQPIIKSGSPGLLSMALGGISRGLGFRLGYGLFR